jgi:hypothetical protein
MLVSRIYLVVVICSPRPIVAPCVLTPGLAGDRTTVASVRPTLHSTKPVSPADGSENRISSAHTLRDSGSPTLDIAYKRIVSTKQRSKLEARSRRTRRHLYDVGERTKICLRADAPNFGIT